MNSFKSRMFLLNQNCSLAFMTTCFNVYFRIFYENTDQEISRIVKISHASIISVLNLISVQTKEFYAETSIWLLLLFPYFLGIKLL
jgi:hypothetical protein